jgi:hypothetical protein
MTGKSLFTSDLAATSLDRLLQFGTLSLHGTPTAQTRHSSGRWAPNPMFSSRFNLLIGQPTPSRLWEVRCFAQEEESPFPLMSSLHYVYN